MSAPLSGEGRLKERKTRVVHYTLAYSDAPYPASIQLNAALNRVRRLLHQSTVVTFYFAKTYNNDVHDLWFEGRPGRELRALRAAITRELATYSPRWT